LFGGKSKKYTHGHREKGHPATAHVPAGQKGIPFFQEKPFKTQKESPFSQVRSGVKPLSGHIASKLQRFRGNSLTNKKQKGKYTRPRENEELREVWGHENANEHN